jgi:hypothetical protein
MFFMPSGEKISKYESDKNVSQNHILSPLALCRIKAVEQCITKEKAMNHELVVA